ncbi:hypothetical protein FDB61_15605 [Clostridium botulinum]|nr:hypothetical protein [Clostridium botulinum]
MKELKSLIGWITNNNNIYIVVCVVLAFVGIKITKKVIKFIMGIIFLAYTLLKFAISSNLINYI